MKTGYDSLFDRLIVAPLQRVAGQRLRAVNYYIVWGEFDPETPNECGGCQGVHLVFDCGEAEFGWAFENEFRGGTGASPITLRSQTIRFAANRSGNGRRTTSAVST